MAEVAFVTVAVPSPIRGPHLVVDFAMPFEELLSDDAVDVTLAEVAVDSVTVYICSLGAGA